MDTLSRSFTGLRVNELHSEPALTLALARGIKTRQGKGDDDLTTLLGKKP